MSAPPTPYSHVCQGDEGADEQEFRSNHPRLEKQKHPNLAEWVETPLKVVGAVPLLRPLPVASPKGVDIDEYLSFHLSDVTTTNDMVLQDREAQLNKLSENLRADLFEGSMRKIVYSYSPRGSGKTQLVRCFLSTKRAIAVKWGRVIVRCCDRAAHEPWALLVKSEAKIDATAARNSVDCMPHTDKGLRELIRTHVEAVTGRRQTLSNYLDAGTAYNTWISETAAYFGIPANVSGVDPLIVLDTCERLAEHEHDSMLHWDGYNVARPYTLLDAFCRCVRSPHCIFVIGCAKIDAEIMPLTNAFIRNIGALPPLSMEGHAKAIAQPLGVRVDEDVRELIYHLAGGLPWLLRAAHQSELGLGSSDALSRCFAKYQEAAKAHYAIEAPWIPHAYACLLASSTKAKVRQRDHIPLDAAWGRLPTRTYDDAAVQSIGLYLDKENRFVLAPITFDDAVMEAAQFAAPILPSQLHPFLSADIVKQLGGDSAADRRELFEKPFLYALYARYLLAYWEKKSVWVPLGKVLECAKSSVVSSTITR
ncbi:Bodo-specific multi-copy gene family, putative [Bodo saltans]|uniref:Bodo-specific multi-copy gene family, putative n=1 Tax=Bodo saltans TaxID=75058 RepID=A0A0S4JSK7_BODSA|nr:Bodo-specific multi-copy gene family, putative [Bodo saltans]|eukprot:CUG92975.1 Bodo-specific multi-copy gene family, putative [Bodo saltans]